MKTEPFDLTEILHKIKDSVSPAQLFQIWNFTCQQYEAKVISVGAFEEVRDILYPKLNTLKELRESIDRNGTSGEINS